MELKMVFWKYGGRPQKSYCIEDTPKTEYHLSSHIQIFKSSLPFVTSKAGQVLVRGGDPYQPLIGSSTPLIGSQLFAAWSICKTKKKTDF